MQFNFIKMRRGIRRWIYVGFLAMSGAGIVADVVSTTNKEKIESLEMEILKLEDFKKGLKKLSEESLSQKQKYRYSELIAHITFNQYEYQISIDSSRRILKITEPLHIIDPLYYTKFAAKRLMN